MPDTSPGRRVIVVDGSNLATEGRTTPSLRQLDEAVQAYALEDPDTEIVVVVDASFEHRIDPSEREELVEAELHGEVVSPPAGAIGRGDAFVLRIAERTGARVLSNDSFQEFHAEHPWLFDDGRLVGGKPVPGVGWIFTPRIPVRGPKSRQVTGKKKRASAALSPPVKAAELARAAKKAAARKFPAAMPDGSPPKVGDVWPVPTRGAVNGDLAAPSPEVPTPSREGVAPSRPAGGAEVGAAGEEAVEPERAATEKAKKRAPSARKKAAGGPEAPEGIEGSTAAGAATDETATKKAATKKAATKKAATKKATAKKAATKKAATKKATAKKAATKKATAEKATAKKAATKKATAEKATAKKAATKKAPAVEATAKKAATKKAPAKKAPAKKRAATTAGAGESAAEEGKPAEAPARTTVPPSEAHPVRTAAREDPVVKEAIDQATAEALSPVPEVADGLARAERSATRSAGAKPGGAKEKKKKGKGAAEAREAGQEGRKDQTRSRRRNVTALPAVNEPLAFINFVVTYPLESEIEGEVVSFTSHGAMVDVDLPDGGLLHCYIPLTAMGDPPPTKARQVLTKGQRRPFVLVGLDPPRRVAELALPEVLASVAGDAD